MITDRAFGADGAMRYPAVDETLLRAPGVLPGYEQGVLGDVILVNGAPWPVADVAAARYRLRLLNASNARRYRLALDPPPPGGAGLVQIGSDGGLLDRPQTQVLSRNGEPPGLYDAGWKDTVDLRPSERVAIIARFSDYAGRYVLHCHNLEHEDMGMMATYEVT